MDTYLDIGLSREIDTLAHSPPVHYLRRLVGVVSQPSRIIPKSSRVTNGARSGANIARRAAGTTSAGASCLLGGAALRMVAGVRTAILRTVARAGVGGAVKGRNIQVTRHDGGAGLSMGDVNGKL